MPLETGDIHFNKNYANTLKAFEKNISEVFYNGYIANDIVSTVNNASHNPGILSLWI